MNEPETSEQKLTNKHTIARRYDVSERTIQEWMAEGTLPFLKIGYIVRFDIAACDRAISRFGVGHDQFTINSLASSPGNLHNTSRDQKRSPIVLIGVPNCGRKNLDSMTVPFSSDVRREMKGDRINPRRIHGYRPGFVPICASKDARVRQTSLDRQKALSRELAKSSEVTHNQQLTMMFRIPSLAPFNFGASWNRLIPSFFAL